MTNGARSFSMQLNPEHLGSVDVRMEVDSKGKTKVAITAERPEPLALLKLDSHHLVKALQDSGVAADQSSLNFSLREQSANNDRRGGSGGSQTARGMNQAATPDAQDTEIIPVKMSLSRHLYDIHA
jgi:flagellar hook-length control protein FliK